MLQRHSGLFGNRATRRINITRATWRGRIQSSPTEPSTAFDRSPGAVCVCLCAVCPAASFASGGISFLPRKAPADVSWRSVRFEQCVHVGLPGRVECGCAGDRSRDGAGEQAWTSRRKEQHLQRLTYDIEAERTLRIFWAHGSCLNELLSEWGQTQTCIKYPAPFLGPVLTFPSGIFFLMYIQTNTNIYPNSPFLPKREL